MRFVSMTVQKKYAQFFCCSFTKLKKYLKNRFISSNTSFVFFLIGQEGFFIFVKMFYGVIGIFRVIFTLKNLSVNSFALRLITLCVTQFQVAISCKCPYFLVSSVVNIGQLTHGLRFCRDTEGSQLQQYSFL